MKNTKISAVIASIYSHAMYRVIPFLEILEKNFLLEVIAGGGKVLPTSTFLKDEIFKKINLKLINYSTINHPIKYINSFIRSINFMKGNIIYCFKLLPRNLSISLINKYLKNKFLIIDVDDLDFAFQQDTVIGKFLKIFERMRKLADLLIVGSMELQNKYGGYYLPTPVDTNLFIKENFDPNLMKDKYHLENNEIILYMGTFGRHKGIKEIFDIFSLVKKERKNVKLLIVGGNKDKSITDKYYQYGKKKCGNDVIFTGFRPHEEMPYFIASCDIFLTPVRDELITWAQTPAKIAEVKSMSKPIVSSNIGEYRNLINNGIDGFLLHPDDLYGFKDKIIYLLENQDEKQKIGSLGRDNCIKNYSFQAIEKKLKKIFKQNSLL